MKKCLVLDLDNTLWGGVVGEDGPEGIRLSLSAPGNSFVAFQQAILDHYHRGVLLAINSRNNPEDALQVIRTHPNMILKESHFAASRINWQDKAQNLRELADELNIGLDSMVFLDDDPTNRALVRSELPEVEVPELPQDPAEYARFLNALGHFSAEAITDEDKMRGNLYVTERLRREAEKHFGTKEEFLKSLRLELSIYEDDASSLSRLAQLTEKTNQFNTAKRPLSEDELQAYVEDPSHRVFYGKLTDTFGDYGVVIFALVELADGHWHIRSLLMSCRVFDRGVEQAFVAHIARKAAAAGAHSLSVSFVETAKNVPAKMYIDEHFPGGARPPEHVAETPAWLKTHENL
jgi:FkbH-like protein